MPSIEELANAADIIVQGYAFIDKGEGITVINLHNTKQAAYFYNDEMVETTMDDIEAYKVSKLYKDNVKYMEKNYAKIL